MLRLLTWKLRVELAGYRRNRSAQIVLVLALLLVGAAFWAMRAIFSVLVPTAPDFADAFVLAAFAVVWFFQTLASLRWSVQRLFLSSDIELLASMPIPARSVTILKVAEVIASSPVSFLVLTAVGWGYLRAHGRPTAIVVAVCAAVLLGAGAALPGLLVGLLITRVFAGRRLRAVLALMPTFAFVLAIAAPAISEPIARVVERDFDAARLDAAGRSLERVVEFLPTSWVAGILSATAHGSWGRLLVFASLALAAVSVLFVVTAVAFDRWFQASLTSISEAGQRVRGGRLFERLAPGFSRPIRALVIKEWKVITRDIRMISQMFFPLVFLGYLAISNLRSDEPGSFRYTPVIFMITFFPAMAAASLFSERRNIAILIGAPITGADVIRAKLAAYGLPIGLLIAAATIAIGFVSGVPLGAIVVLGVFAPWSLCWAMLLHLGLVALWGDIGPDRARLPFVASLAAVFGDILVIGSQMLLGIWIAGRFGVGPIRTLVAGPAIALLTAAGCGAALGVASGGARRLDRVDAP
jgi:hypothetical protein